MKVLLIEFTSYVHIPGVTNIKITVTWNTGG